MATHPKQYEVEVIQPDGKKFLIKSTDSNGGNPIECDIGPSNHPAWRKGDGNDASYLEAKKSVSNFRRRYGSYGGSRLSKNTDS